MCNIIQHYSPHTALLHHHQIMLVFNQVLARLKLRMVPSQKVMYVFVSLHIFFFSFCLRRSSFSGAPGLPGPLDDFPKDSIQTSSPDSKKLKLTTIDQFRFPFFCSPMEARRVYIESHCHPYTPCVLFTSPPQHWSPVSST